MNDFTISGISIDENTGVATMKIEGQFTVPTGCDDPIIELFRPIREKYTDEILFIVLVSRGSDGATVCTLNPSNRRNRPKEEFLEIAIRNLRGEDGIINEYQTVLELFFSEENGLRSYLENLEAGNYDQCNIGIKQFVKELGMEMPSMKGRTGRKTC